MPQTHRRTDPAICMAVRARSNRVEFGSCSAHQASGQARACTAEHGRGGLRSSQGQRPPGAATAAARGREQLPCECRCAERRRPHDAARRYASCQFLPLVLTLSRRERKEQAHASRPPARRLPRTGVTPANGCTSSPIPRTLCRRLKPSRPRSCHFCVALPPLLCCDAACYQGGYDCARVLLEKGRADVHATGKDCRSTPLQFAALSGNMDLVKLMLKYQVSPLKHGQRTSCTRRRTSRTRTRV